MTTLAAKQNRTFVCSSVRIIPVDITLLVVSICVALLRVIILPRA